MYLGIVKAAKLQMYHPSRVTSTAGKQLLDGLHDAEVLMGDTRLLVREQQERVLALFRKGHSNMLFTTSVAEEGLDVQNCSLVVCYDVPNRPLSLIQTVGRARARDACVVFMEQSRTDASAPMVRLHITCVQRN
jgi:ERCC4-related helicase